MRRITLFLFAALVVTSVDAASYQKLDGTIVDPILDISGNPFPYAGSNLEPYVNLSDVDLAYADLFQANLIECIGEYVDLTGAYLSHASLGTSNISNATLAYADLTNAYLQYANLTYGNLSSADLTGADLYFTNLDRTNLTDATFSGATLNYARLTHANLYGTLLTGANLTNADLQYATLTYANLSGSIFTNTQNYTDATWTDAFYYVGDEPTWASGMDAAWRTRAGIQALTPPNAVPEPATLLLALFGLALLPRRRRR